MDYVVWEITKKNENEVLTYTQTVAINYHPLDLVKIVLISLRHAQSNTTYQGSYIIYMVNLMIEAYVTRFIQLTMELEGRAQLSFKPYSHTP